MQSSLPDIGFGIEDETSQEVKRPQLYKVILLNDDYTTMDFVVHILESVFGKDPVEATAIMLQVHKTGSGVAGIYPYEIAETKVEEVHSAARDNEFPLQCRIEPA